MVRLMKNQRGFTLVEVIIALGVLGIIGVAFLGALSTGSKALIISDVQTTAESLARSQMEDIKVQDYIDYSDPDHGDYVKIAPPSGFSIDITAEPFDPATGEPYDNAGGIFVQDDGIQKIIVTVKHPDDKTVITLEGYKVDR